MLEICIKFSSAETQCENKLLFQVIHHLDNIQNKTATMPKNKRNNDIKIYLLVKQIKTHILT